MLTDILESTWRGISAITNDWVLKIIASGLFILMARHMAIFTLFAMVVLIDLFSKFLALSHQMEVSDEREDLSIVAALHGIPEAHRRGIINSYAMRVQFMGKVLMYILLVIPAGSIDALITISGGKSEFCVLVISYLAAAELLSIVENLDDAGVSVVHGLATLIRRKTGM